MADQHSAGASGRPSWRRTARLIAQLPETATRDIPPPLASLPREEPSLVENLTAFLAHLAIRTEQMF